MISAVRPQLARSKRIAAATVGDKVLNSTSNKTVADAINPAQQYPTAANDINHGSLSTRGSEDGMITFRPAL